MPKICSNKLQFTTMNIADDRFSICYKQEQSSLLKINKEGVRLLEYCHYFALLTLKILKLISLGHSIMLETLS